MTQKEIAYKAAKQRYSQGDHIGAAQVMRSTHTKEEIEWLLKIFKQYYG